MASLTWLLPTHPLLLHRDSAFPTIPSSSFNHSSSFDWVLSFANRPRLPQTALPRAVAKIGFSLAQDEVASPGDLEFEAPLKIVEYPDPKLRAKNKRIATFDDNLKKLVHEMFDIMYKSNFLVIKKTTSGGSIYQRQSSLLQLHVHVRQAVWLKRVLGKLDQNQSKSCVIQCDSSSAIKLSKNPIMYGRSKHIDVHFHFRRDLTKDGIVELVHCDTQDQLADIVTKPLKLNTFVKLREQMGVCSENDIN